MLFLLIVTIFHPFFRPLLQLHVFTSNSDWFVGLPVYYVFGESDNFGFGHFDCPFVVVVVL